jgi:hypothetical protein
MPASDDWGKAHINNSIGFGGASDNVEENGFGAAYEKTETGQTYLSKAIATLKGFFSNE